MTDDPMLNLLERISPSQLHELLDYVDHQSWRCQYRTRYHECCCGLDDLLRDLGLPPVPVADPEADR